MALDLAKIVQVHLKIRDKRALLKKAFEAEDAVLKGNQSRLEGELLRFLQENNTDSANTAFGTFYRQEDITPSATDWDAFYKWVAANDAFDALERRLKKTFVKEYMEAHEGELPPGVAVYREYVVRVRRT